MSGSPVLLAQAVREIGRAGFTVVELRKLIDAHSIPLHDVNGRRGVLVSDVREALDKPDVKLPPKPRIKTKRQN